MDYFWSLVIGIGIAFICFYSSQKREHEEHSKAINEAKKELSGEALDKAIERIYYTRKVVLEKDKQPFNLFLVLVIFFTVGILITKITGCSIVTD